MRRLLLLVAVLLVAGCIGRAITRSIPKPPPAPAPPAAAPVPAPAPTPTPVAPPKPTTVAEADEQIASARAQVDALTAQLAFFNALVAVKEASREQLAKDAERDARQAQSAAQARWLTWIAGLIFVVGVAAAIAGFWLPILPKRWGGYTALGGLALLVASRVWTWAGDHSLALGLGALAIAGAFGARAWWRTASAARHIAQVGDRLEGSHGAMRDWVKVNAREIQEKAGMVDLVRRLRGKPKPKQPALKGA